MKTPTDLYVGIDSKVNTTGYYTGGNKTSSSNYVCKIKQAGKFYFVGAGIAVEPLFDVAISAGKASMYTHEISGHFIALAIKKLEEQMAEIKKYDSVRYSKFNKSSHLVSMTFFRMEPLGPQAINFEFYAQNIPGKASKITCTPSPVNDISVLGHSEGLSVDSPKKREIDQLLQTRPVDGIVTLIQYEAQLNPQDVSAPITVFHLTSKGNEWFPTKNLCNDSSISGAKKK